MEEAPALVLANPVSLGKRGLSFGDLERLLARHGIPATAEELPEFPDHGYYRDRLSREGRSMVVAAGGDGTLHHVANIAGPVGVRMGALPLGTANDFARTLGLPSELEPAASRIAAGVLRVVDLGQVNGRLFLNAGHMGLGVETAKQTLPWLKRSIGPLAYGVAAVQAWRKGRPIAMAVTTDDRTFEVPAVQLLVGNGRYFGGGLQIAPDATLSDSLLDVHILDWPLSLWEAATWMFALKKGTLARQRGALHLRTQRLEVAMNELHDLNLDGEVLALGARLDFAVVPGALRVFS